MMSTRTWPDRQRTEEADDYRRQGLWRDRTIADGLGSLMADRPDWVCLVDDLGRHTVAEIDRKARRLAGWLERQGFARGDVVAFQLPNWHETAAIALASNGASGEIPMDVSDLKKLLATFWFRSVFTRLSSEWQDRLLEQLLATTPVLQRRPGTRWLPLASCAPPWEIGCVCAATLYASRTIGVNTFSSLSIYRLQSSKHEVSE